MGKKKKKETEQHVQCAPISAYVFKGDNTSTPYICIKYTQKNTYENAKETSNSGYACEDKPGSRIRDLAFTFEWLEFQKHQLFNI